MENFAILFDSLICVAIRVNRDKDGHDIEVSVLFARLNLIHRPRQLHQRHRTDVWAVCETKVDKIVLPSETGVRDRVALRVIEHPWATNVCLARVGGRCLQLGFLVGLTVFLALHLHDIGGH